MGRGGGADGTPAEFQHPVDLYSLGGNVALRIVRAAHVHDDAAAREHALAVRADALAALARVRNHERAAVHQEILVRFHARGAVVVFAVRIIAGATRDGDPHGTAVELHRLVGRNTLFHRGRNADVYGAVRHCHAVLAAYAVAGRRGRHDRGAGHKPNIIIRSDGGLALSSDGQ